MRPFSTKWCAPSLLLRESVKRKAHATHVSVERRGIRTDDASHRRPVDAQRPGSGHHLDHDTRRRVRPCAWSGLQSLAMGTDDASHRRPVAPSPPSPLAPQRPRCDATSTTPRVALAARRTGSARPRRAALRHRNRRRFPSPPGQHAAFRLRTPPGARNIPALAAIRSWSALASRAHARPPPPAARAAPTFGTARRVALAFPSPLPASGCGRHQASDGCNAERGHSARSATRHRRSRSRKHRVLRVLPCACAPPGWYWRRR
jgi:hypothetical protein